MPLFHYSLNPGGILFLGSAESVGTLADLFAPWPASNASSCGARRACRSHAVDFPPASGHRPPG